MKSTVLYRRELREVKAVIYNLKGIIFNAISSTEEHYRDKHVEIILKRKHHPVTKTKMVSLVVTDNVNYIGQIEKTIGITSYIKGEMDVLFLYISKLASKGFEEIEKDILSKTPPLT